MSLTDFTGRGGVGFLADAGVGLVAYALAKNMREHGLRKKKTHRRPCSIDHVHIQKTHFHMHFDVSDRR